nr:MAG TPA: hypothetical protein [Caudoviricetes sp.]
MYSLIFVNGYLLAILPIKTIEIFFSCELIQVFS